MHHNPQYLSIKHWLFKIIDNKNSNIQTSTSHGNYELWEQTRVAPKNDSQNWNCKLNNNAVLLYPHIWISSALLKLDSWGTIYIGAVEWEMLILKAIKKFSTTEKLSSIKVPLCSWSNLNLIDSAISFLRH